MKDTRACLQMTKYTFPRISQRFVLAQVDFQTLEQKSRESAAWYRIAIQAATPLDDTQD